MAPRAVGVLDRGGGLPPHQPATETEPEMSEKPPLDVLMCAPRGFCAGVVRAIDVVERALAIYGEPVYVRHEIVHNKYVVESLQA